MGEPPEAPAPVVYACKQKSNASLVIRVPVPGKWYNMGNGLVHFDTIYIQLQHMGASGLHAVLMQTLIIN